MKIILVGARGTVGSKIEQALKARGGAEVIRVGRTSGDYQVDISSRESVRALFQKIGAFDALVNASGDVAFAPLSNLSPENWTFSVSSKLMGQIHLVQEALPYINEKGSFTLVSGITSEEAIYAGVAAATINRAVEGFVETAATDLPKGLRINVVSPSLLLESAEAYGPYFPGFMPVEGARVAQAYLQSIFGIQTGKILRVF